MLRDFQDIRGDVCLENISFAYPIQPRCLVLNGVTIRAPAGKTIALVGPSGCGKSTTIQLLERLYDPMDGRVVRVFEKKTDCNA
jgi:ABC-type multidrug transport system fused ATPase/permease subunit